MAWPPIKECVECHEVKKIHGRGMCARCYMRWAKTQKKAPVDAAHAEPVTPQLPPEPVPEESIASTPLIDVAEVSTNEVSEEYSEPSPELKQLAAEIVESIPASCFKPAENCVVTIDLSGRPEIYARLVAIAEDQDRTPELQARFIIRQFVAGSATPEQ